MTGNDKCKGVFGWFFGHKYEPRYDYQKGPLPNTIERIRGAYPEALEELMPVKETYIHDVCERCGDVIKKEDRRAGL